MAVLGVVDVVHVEVDEPVGAGGPHRAEHRLDAVPAAVAAELPAAVGDAAEMGAGMLARAHLHRAAGAGLDPARLGHPGSRVGARGAADLVQGGAGARIVGEIAEHAMLERGESRVQGDHRARGGGGADGAHAGDALLEPAQRGGERAVLLQQVRPHPVQQDHQVAARLR